MARSAGADEPGTAGGGGTGDRARAWDELAVGADRCTACAYSLIGLPATTDGTRVCPECGDIRPPAALSGLANIGRANGRLADLKADGAVSAWPACKWELLQRLRRSMIAGPQPGRNRRSQPVTCEIRLK